VQPLHTRAPRGQASGYRFRAQPGKSSRGQARRRFNARGEAPAVDQARRGGRPRRLAAAPSGARASSCWSWSSFSGQRTCSARGPSRPPRRAAGSSCRSRTRRCPVRVCRRLGRSRSGGGGFNGPVTIATTGDYFDLFDENGLDPDPEAATTNGDLLIWEFGPPHGDVLTVTFDARLEPASHLRRSAETSVLVDRDAVVSVRYSTVVMP
jgi:hypothetical protein